MMKIIILTFSTLLEAHGPKGSFPVVYDKRSIQALRANMYDMNKHDHSPGVRYVLFVYTTVSYYIKAFGVYEKRSKEMSEQDFMKQMMSYQVKIEIDQPDFRLAGEPEVSTRPEI